MAEASTGAVHKRHEAAVWTGEEERAMPVWLDVIIGVICSFGLVGGIFWFAFARAPERRSDGGLTKHDAVNYTSAFTGDDGGDPSS
jgi:hypothetical protein